MDPPLPDTKFIYSRRYRSCRYALSFMSASLDMGSIGVRERFLFEFRRCAPRSGRDSCEQPGLGRVGQCRFISGVGQCPFIRAEYIGVH